MRLRLLLQHRTARKPVFIARSQDGRFHVVYDGESLGSYASIAQAVDDAAGGHTFAPGDGTDLGSLGLSSDSGDWEPAGEQ